MSRKLFRTTINFQAGKRKEDKKTERKSNYRLRSRRSRSCCLHLHICTQEAGDHLNDYAEPNVVVNGYNGYGEISVDFDYDGMYEDTVDIVKLPDVSDDDWYVSGEMAYSDGIYELIAGHFEPSENLSNGDEPVLIWDISPEYEEYFEDTFRCRIKYNEFTYSINGLEDIETVDPFKEGDFTLDFSGTAPDGMAMVSNNAHQEISYEVTPQAGCPMGIQ